MSGALGRKVKEARGAKGLSLRQLEDQSGVSRAHVCAIENGRAINPTVGALLQLAGPLGLSLRTLAYAAADDIRDGHQPKDGRQ